MLPDTAPSRGIEQLWSEVRKLRAEVRFLRSSQNMLSQGTIGRNGLVIADGGDITINGGDLRVRTPGDMQLEDPDGSVIWRASVDPLRTSGCYDANNGLSLATTWTNYGGTTPLTSNVPAGFTFGNFVIWVTAGDSFSTTGNVSVQPTVKFVWGDGTTPTTYVGDAVNSGNGDVRVASSFWSSNFAPGPAGTKLVFGALAVRTGAEATSTSGNWHVGAQVIYRRAA